MFMERFPGDLQIGSLNEPLNERHLIQPMTIGAKIQVLIILSGSQAFSIDNVTIDLNAQRAPQAVIMRIDQAAILDCSSSYTGNQRKIRMEMPHNWLTLLQGEATMASLPLLSEHLDHQIWSPSAETITLAERIVFPPSHRHPLERSLFRMSCGVEILRRSLSEINTHASEASRSYVKRSAEDIRLHILGHLSEDLSLAALEEKFCINRRSLQRTFKSHYGITISDFIRKQRLDQAYDALKNHASTIAQAAHLACYTSAANFATAFRREYNVSPGELMRGSAR